MSLTRRQAQVLAFLKGYLRDHNGVAPSLLEIARALDIRSKSQVHYIMTELERRGRIVRQAYRQRSVRIVEQNENNGGG